MDEPLELKELEVNPIFNLDLGEHGTFERISQRHVLSVDINQL